MKETINNSKALSMLWLTAAIWGFAFVAQRSGMEFIGPYLFNGIRFGLGSLSLIPLIYLLRKNGKEQTIPFNKALKGGLIAGLVLFAGASLQQSGMVYTTAGKAGFITGLYLIIVPVIGIFLGQKIGARMWLGTLLALGGLFLLTYQGNVLIEKGDLLVLMSAFFWAGHVQLINHLVKKIPPLLLSSIQFAVCSLLSLIVAAISEPVHIGSIQDATLPLLYGGFLSVGIAYTLQVFAQQFVAPTFASIILSFETVFAAIGGWLLLHEQLTGRNLAGCALMLTGMLLVQIRKEMKAIPPL